MESNQEVTIEVLTPEKRSQIGGVNKYFVYAIRGKDAKGQIDITRRYSDFYLLREILVKRWPGIFISSLPEKKTIGFDDKVFIESRRRGLEYFLVSLSQNSKIWKSQEVEIFLRNNSGDSDKLLSPLMKESFDKILARYRQLFPEFEEKPVTKESQDKIQQFNSYLKASKPILQKLSEMTNKLQEVSKRSLEKKLVLLEFLLPDYEKACLLQNDQKKKSQNLLFSCSKSNGIFQSIQKFKKLNQYPPTLLIHQEIKRQRKEIEAFEELLKIRDQYQADMNKSVGKVKDAQIQGTKINAGKQSLLSKIKKVSKEEQLQSNKRHIEKYKTQEQNYTIICQIITNIITTLQIDRFKHKRQKAYFQLLKKYAKEERDLSQGETDIWVQVGRHDWIALQEEHKILPKKNLEEQYKPKMQNIKQEEQGQKGYNSLAEQQIKNDEEL